MERSLPQLEARTEALKAQRDAIEIEDAAEVCLENLAARHTVGLSTHVCRVVFICE